MQLNQHRKFMANVFGHILMRLNHHYSFVNHVTLIDFFSLNEFSFIGDVFASPNSIVHCKEVIQIRLNNTRSTSRHS